MVAACSQKSTEPSEPIAEEPSVKVPQNALPGVLLVKFSSEPGEEELSEIEASGVYKLSRLYPPAGKFEKRHREAGLHLWYNVEFNEELPLTKAAGEFAGLPSVSLVDFARTVRKMEAPFNDPRLSSQWHYYNDGSKSGAVAGCDINLFPAWETETGSPDVIVAVSDGGVDFTHPDLAANMWINEAEANGIEGVDDDHNGYVDDVYGYCFLAQHPTTDNPGHIVFDSHGTHVAGTIAAVNNNGEGVCGIAGGNGSPSSGVRIMTLQTSGGSAYIQPPFVYAADNGAVLMNCSWGYDETPDPSGMSAFREAVNYFNRYAGFDENGNQTGPMAGGLAIFAAGNDDSDVAYPCMENSVLAVAAVAHDYRRAYYSNYGDWVDIAAPGGDSRKSAQVLSTVPGSYSQMQGTSMACPHVTGVAALVVSHFKGVGFTRQNLIDILTNSARDIDAYNPNYAGKLGAGLVDAYAAVNASTLDPEKPAAVNSSAVANYIYLDWIRGGSTDAKVPFAYELFYGRNSLSGLNPDNPGAGVQKVVIPGRDIAVGGSVQYRIEGLDFETDYHVRVRSFSILNRYSDLTDDVLVHTLANTAPTITPLQGTSFSVTSFGISENRFSIGDADGHPLTCSVDVPGATVSIEDDSYAVVRFNALSVPDGATYTGKLSVSDSYAVTQIPLSFTVAANNAPRVTGQVGSRVMNQVGESFVVKMSDFFDDADGETLSYGVRSLTSGTIVSGTIADGSLIVKSVAYGTATLRVTGIDARGASAQLDFDVLVRDGSRPLEVYPNPVVDNLYLRTGEDDTAEVRISNRAGATVYEGKGLAVTPFEPLSIDLSGLKAGVYYLHYKGNALDETFTIIKK